VATETPTDLRRQREADFHDEWANSVDVDGMLVDETFTSITALENQHVKQVFGDIRGLRVLDYGCGAAEAGVYFAKQGAHVVAVDVSPKMLELAQRLAHRHGVTIETRLVDRERIPADDAEFDRIYGNGVLHHVPHVTAIPELARIMRPTGLGCFIEPLPYNPVINIYRKIAKEVRTPDEMPISFPQIASFRNSFHCVNHQEFWLSSLAVFLKFYLWDRVNPNHERYWKKIYTDAAKIEPWFKYLKDADRALLTWIPFLGRYCWNTVISLSQPKTK
jgi:SAM-dependent methyltransferase